MSQDQSLALRPSEASYCTFDQCSDGTWEGQGRNTAVPFELSLERIETQRRMGDIPGRVHRGVEVLEIVTGCGRWRERHGEGRRGEDKSQVLNGCVQALGCRILRTGQMIHCRMRMLLRQFIPSLGV